jgi:hypothetical protein
MKVYITLNERIFTSQSINELDVMWYNLVKNDLITDCKIEQTNYGSVIITKPNGRKIEYYPNSIKHIIHN